MAEDQQEPRILDLSHVDIHGASLVGQVLNDLYLIEERVGVGGMAWVYRASHIQLGGDVAIKILLSNFTHDEQKKQRFIREAKIQNQLTHPHIVHVQNVIQYKGLFGFVMEWCNGGNLLTWLKKAKGPLSLDQLRVLFPPLIDAIGHAHDNDVIHRDLKPHNILLHMRGELIVPKVTDFGIAKMLQAAQLTAPGELMGTLEYAAPEQLKDSKRVDHRTDIYGLGMLLYRMSTGRLPFQGTPAALIKQVTESLPTSPVEAPAPLQALILQCLEKDPEARFQSCAAFKEAFCEAASIKDASGSLREIAPSSLGGAPTPHGSASQIRVMDDSDTNETNAPGQEVLGVPAAPAAPVRRSLRAPNPRIGADESHDTEDLYDAIGALREEHGVSRKRTLLMLSMVGVIALLLGVIVYLLMRTPG